MFAGESAAILVGGALDEGEFDRSSVTGVVQQRTGDGVIAHGDGHVGGDHIGTMKMNAPIAR